MPSKVGEVNPLVEDKNTGEPELITGLRKGEATSYAEFCNRYLNRIYSHVFHAVGQDRILAEDIVQDVFVAALGSLSQFRGDSGLYTWLVSIAHHKIADYYRRRVREEAYIHQIGTDRSRSKYESMPEVANAKNIESSDQINRVMMQLPADYREVLLLKYGEALSTDQIARVTGRSAKSVEGLLARARSAFRAKLTDVGSTAPGVGRKHSREE